MDQIIYYAMIIVAIIIAVILVKKVVGCMLRTAIGIVLVAILWYICHNYLHLF